MPLPDTFVADAPKGFRPDVPAGFQPDPPDPQAAAVGDFRPETGGDATAIERAKNAVIAVPQSFALSVGNSISGVARARDTLVEGEGLAMFSPSPNQAKYKSNQRFRAFEAAMLDPSYSQHLIDARSPEETAKIERLLGPPGKLEGLQFKDEQSRIYANNLGLEQQKRLETDPLYQYGQEYNQAAKTVYPTDPALDQKIESKFARAVGGTLPTVALSLIPGVGPALATTQYATGQSESGAVEAIEAGHPELASEAALLNLFTGAASEYALGATSKLKSILASPRLAVYFKRFAAAYPKTLGVTEAVVREIAQEGLEQGMGNVIAADVVGYDPNRPWSQGVMEAGGLGGAAVVPYALLGSFARRGRGAAPASQSGGNESSAALDRVNEQLAANPIRPADPGTPAAGGGLPAETRAPAVGQFVFQQGGNKIVIEAPTENIAKEYAFRTSPGAVFVRADLPAAAVADLKTAAPGLVAPSREPETGAPVPSPPDAANLPSPPAAETVAGIASSSDIALIERSISNLAYRMQQDKARGMTRPENVQRLAELRAQLKSANLPSTPAATGAKAGRTSVNPKTDELLGTNNRGEPIYWSHESKTHYTVSDGKIRTAPWTEGLSENALTRLDELILPPAATGAPGQTTWKIIKTYKGSDGGMYSDYSLGGNPRGGSLTVELNKNGYRIRNIFVGGDNARKGNATRAYEDLNAESLLKTGNPLRSSEIGYGKKSGSTSQSVDATALWDSLVAKGKASKVGDHYEFKPTPAESGATAQKMPWEMTGQEYMRSKRVTFDTVPDQSKFDAGKQVAARKDHEMLVRTAVREGKPVPESVLADYPDLKPTPAATGATGQKLPGEMVRGDRFKDANGVEFEVWRNRQGTIEAHPVVNGKPVVNKDSGVRFSVTDEAKARNPEDRTDLKPAPPARPVNPRVATGADWKASTPVSGNKVSGQWEVVNLDDILTSQHPDFDQTLQPRDRSRAASKEQIAKIAAGLEPERLGESPTTDNGSPIVDEFNQALTGNGRLAALTQVYGAGGERAGAYQHFVKSQAARLGIDPAKIAGMQSPVLVRRVTDYGKLTKQDFARLSNESQVLGMSPAEKAGRDAAMVRDNPNLMDAFLPSEDGDVLAASNRGFLNAFVQGSGDHAELLNADGSYNVKTLAPRVKNAVLGAVLGHENRGLLNDLIDRASELNVSKAATGVMTAAPRLLKHRGTVYDLGATLGQALSDLVRIRTKGEKLGEFLDQSGLFADPLRTAESDFLLRKLHEGASAKQIAQGLARYAELASKQDLTTGDIFGNLPASRPDLLKQAYENDTAPKNSQDDLSFRKPAPPVAEAEGPAGSAGGGVQASPKLTSLAPSDSSTGASVNSPADPDSAMAAVQAIVNEEAGDVSVTVNHDATLTHDGQVVEGYVHPVTGEIVLNSAAPTMADPANVRRVVREERAHWQLSFTAEGRQALREFIGRITPADRAELQRQGYRRLPGETATDYEARLTNEYIAKQARENTAWWRKLVERVREWLAKNGLAKLSNAEAARAILRRLNAADAARNTSRAGVNFNPAPQMSLQRGVPKPDESYLQSKRGLDSQYARWDLGRDIDNESVSVTSEQDLNKDGTPDGPASFRVDIGDGWRDFKTFEEAWRHAKGLVGEAESAAAAEKAADQAHYEAKRNLRDGEFPIDNSKDFVAALVKVSTSRQSQSTYLTVYLRPKDFETAKRLKVAESDSAADFNESRSDFGDSLAVEFRVSDHPATDSAKSEPDIDLRIGDPRNAKQVRARSRFGAPDSPTEWYGSWAKAFDDVVNKALEFSGDEQGRKVERRNLSAAASALEGRIKTESVESGKPPSSFMRDTPPQSGFPVNTQFSLAPVTPVSPETQTQIAVVESQSGNVNERPPAPTLTTAPELRSKLRDMVGSVSGVIHYYGGAALLRDNRGIDLTASYQAAAVKGQTDALLQQLFGRAHAAQPGLKLPVWAKIGFKLPDWMKVGGWEQRVRAFTKRLLHVAARLNATGRNLDGTFKFDDFKVRSGMMTIRAFKDGKHAVGDTFWHIDPKTEITEQFEVGPFVTTPDGRAGHQIFRSMEANTQAELYRTMQESFPELMWLLDMFIDPALASVRKTINGIEIPVFNRFAQATMMAEADPNFTPLTGYTPDVLVSRSLLGAIRGALSFSQGTRSPGRKYKFGTSRESGHVRDLLTGFNVRTFQMLQEKARREWRNAVLKAAKPIPKGVVPAGWVKLETGMEELWQAAKRLRNWQSPVRYQSASEKLEQMTLDQLRASLDYNENLVWKNDEWMIEYTPFKETQARLADDGSQEYKHFFSEIFALRGKQLMLPQPLIEVLLKKYVAVKQHGALYRLAAWGVRNSTQLFLVMPKTYLANVLTNDLFALEAGTRYALRGLMSANANDLRFARNLFTGTFTNRFAAFRQGTGFFAGSDYMTAIRETLPDQIFADSTSLADVKVRWGNSALDYLRQGEIGGAALQIGYGSIDVRAKQRMAFAFLKATAVTNAKRDGLTGNALKAAVDRYLANPPMNDRIQAVEIANFELLNYADSPQVLNDMAQNDFSRLVLPFPRFGYHYITKQLKRLSAAKVLIGKVPKGQRADAFADLVTVGLYGGGGGGILALALASALGGDDDDDARQRIGTSTVPVVNADGSVTMRPIDREFVTANRMNISAWARASGIESDRADDFWLRVRNYPVVAAAGVTALAYHDAKKYGAATGARQFASGAADLASDFLSVGAAVKVPFKVLAEWQSMGKPMAAQSLVDPFATGVPLSFYITEQLTDSFIPGSRQADELIAWINPTRPRRTASKLLNYSPGVVESLESSHLTGLIMTLARGGESGLPPAGQIDRRTATVPQPSVISAEERWSSLGGFNIKAIPRQEYQRAIQPNK